MGEAAECQPQIARHAPDQFKGSAWNQTSLQYGTTGPRDAGGTAGDIGKKHRPNLLQNEKPSALTPQAVLTGSIRVVTKHDQIAQTRWFFK